MSNDDTRTPGDSDSGNRWESDADAQATDDTAEIDQTTNVESPAAEEKADGVTTASTSTRSERFRAATRRPRVLAGSAAAALILTGLGGFSIGHATAGDENGSVSSPSDAGPRDGLRQDRADRPGAPMGGRGDGGSDGRADQPGADGSADGGADGGAIGESSST